MKKIPFHLKTEGIFVYDISNYKSFQHLEKWVNFITTDNNGFPIVIVGTHSDMDKERMVSKAKANRISEMLKYPFFECSSKNGDDVSEIFDTIIQYLYFQRINNQTEKK